MTPEQADYVKNAVRGTKIDDIGCGYSPFRPIVHPSGCDYLGIDKEKISHGNVIQFDLSKPCPHLRYDIALVSWPLNRRSIAWHLFLRRYKEIIYIGKNTDGIVCGDPEFWEIVGKREILKVIPDPAETLIHYGEKPRANQPRPAEEAAAEATWKNGKLTRFIP